MSFIGDVAFDKNRARHLPHSLVPAPDAIHIGADDPSALLLEGDGARRVASP